MTDKESDISLSVARVSIRCAHAADYPNPTPFAIPFLEQYLEKSAFFMAKMDGYWRYEFR